MTALALLLAFSFAAPAAAEVGFDFRGSVVAAHHIQSGWKAPKFVVAEFVLGPHIGGLYIGGVGVRQVDGFGTVVPLVTYVGQGVVPKLSFLRGVTVTFAMSNQGVFSGKPAYFFGVGVATK